MQFEINDKIYNIEQSENLFLFMKENNIFIPSINNDPNSNLSAELCYVEINNELKNAKEVMIEDGLVVKTNTALVYEYINSTIGKEEIIPILHKEIQIDKNYYNILLCQPEVYEEMLEKYKDCGFNDIVNAKFAEMITLIEYSDAIIKLATKKYENKNYVSKVIMQHSLVKYPKKYLLNIASSEEIATRIINKYYKEQLQIKKDIRVIYVTTSSKYLASFNSSKKDYNVTVYDTVLINNFNVIKSDNCYDGLVSGAIYQKPVNYFNISANVNIIYKILREMGSIENQLSITTLDIGKQIKLEYDGFCIKILYAKFNPTIEQLLTYDFDIYIVSLKKETTILSKERGFLHDYNINLIYKNYLEKPGSSDIIKRY